MDTKIFQSTVFGNDFNDDDTDDETAIVIAEDDDYGRNAVIEFI